MSGASNRVFTAGDVFAYEHKGYYKIINVTQDYVEIVGLCDYDGFEYKSAKPIRLDKPTNGRWWGGTGRIGPSLTAQEVEQICQNKIKNAQAEFDRETEKVKRIRAAIPTILFP